MNIIKLLAYYILLIAFLGSCSPTGHKQSEANGHDGSNSKEVNENSSYDQLIATYIQQSDYPLIQAARKAKDKIEYIKDRTEETDTATYFVYNIGHEVMDEDSSNVRFVTYEWIYIDSLSNKLYEYDIINDELTEWE